MNKLTTLKVTIVIYFLIFLVGHIDFTNYSFKTDINFLISFYLFCVPLNMLYFEDVERKPSAKRTVLYSLLGPLFSLYIIFA